MEYDINDLRNALTRASQALIENKELLTYIDNLSGDGDLGISMEKTGKCILRELGKRRDDGIDGLLHRCSISVNLDAPSTMGTLTSFAILEASKHMEGKERFAASDLIRIPQKMTEIIMIRGRAQLGDKTVLDSLIPYAEAISDSYFASHDIEAAVAHAAECAEAAAKETKGMACEDRAGKVDCRAIQRLSRWRGGCLRDLRECDSWQKDRHTGLT
jgi:dihydroxyacetone kinase-like protein